MYYHSFQLYSQDVPGARLYTEPAIALSLLTTHLSCQHHNQHIFQRIDQLSASIRACFRMYIYTIHYNNGHVSRFAAHVPQHNKAYKVRTKVTHGTDVVTVRKLPTD